MLKETFQSASVTTCDSSAWWMPHMQATMDDVITTRSTLPARLTAPSTLTTPRTVGLTTRVKAWLPGQLRKKGAAMWITYLHHKGAGAGGEGLCVPWPLT